MAITLQTEQVYSGRESAGVSVLVACGMLSLISVLCMIIILGMSAVRSRRSSDKTLFIRTHVAIYFFSLLICDLVQGIGALFNIPWIVEKRAYIGTLCTAQATIKQIGNVGTAIFSFVIAAHTFSLLFLRRQWSDRTCYIILIVSWGLLVLDLCIGNFIVADPEGRGSYYGISGYWCWITPAYPTERYTTEYLFMFASAGFSFILYSLVFLRLRGNITVSTGYKIHFHQRPKVKIGRTNAGTYIVTDDRRVESHLTTVAKQMLWYPIAYTLLVLPIAAARFSTFSGASVPFPVTIFTAAVFMLSGFVNAVLFCTTRNVLPGSWRQRFGIGTTLDSGRGDVGLSSRTNATWRLAESGARMGAAGAGTAPVVLSVGVEKDVEIKYDEPEPNPSFLKYGSATSPTSPLRAHSGRGRADSYSHHIRQFSFPPPRDARKSVRIDIDGDDEDSDRGKGVHSASREQKIEWDIPQHPVNAFRGRDSGMYGPAPGLEAPTSVHPFAMASPVNNNTKQARSPSVSTSETAVNQIRLSQTSGDFGGNGSGVHWTGYNRRLSQTQHTGIYPPEADDYPHSAPYPSTDSRHPSGY